MRLKANDTLHVSSVKAENIQPGEEFEVSDDFGRQMIERGLATEVGGGKAAKTEQADPPKPTDPPKADAPPLNKMDAPPSNKSVKTKRKGK